MNCRCNHAKANHEHLNQDRTWCGVYGCECSMFLESTLTPDVIAAIQQGDVDFFTRLDEADKLRKANGVEIRPMAQEWE